MNIIDIASRYLDDLDRETLRTTLQSPYTLVVPWDVPAMPAARIIDLNDPALVVIVEDDIKHVVGVLHPSWILQGMAKHKGRSFPTLSKTVEDMMSDPAEISRGFHHEWMSGRHNIYRCPGPLPHFIASKPCPAHS